MKIASSGEYWLTPAHMPKCKVGSVFLNVSKGKERRIASIFIQFRQNGQIKDQYVGEMSLGALKLIVNEVEKYKPIQIQSVSKKKFIGSPQAPAL